MFLFSLRGGGKRLIFSLLLVWLLILIYVSTFLFHSADEPGNGGGVGGGAGGSLAADGGGAAFRRRDSSSASSEGGGGGGGGEDLQRRLDSAMRELEAVKRQNRDLQKMALEIREARHVVAQEMKGDKVPAEVAGLRRRLERALKELEKTSLSAPNFLSFDSAASDGGGVDGADSPRRRFGAAAAPSSAHELMRIRIERSLREANRFFVGQMKAFKGKLDAAGAAASAAAAAAAAAANNNNNFGSMKRRSDGGEGPAPVYRGGVGGGYSFSDPRARPPPPPLDDGSENRNSIGVSVDAAGIASPLRGADAESAASLISALSSRLASLSTVGGDHLRALVADVEAFRDLDGLGEWRAREAQDLSRIVQAKLDFLQNPKDCRTAKKLVCNLNKGCGYGCQLHHAVYCLVVAFASRRTLVLESAGWRYQPDGGWDSVFQPISRTCLISNAALLALEKRANDTAAASSNAANPASQSRPDATNGKRGFTPPRLRKKRLRTNIPWGAPSLHPDALEVEIPIIDSINPRPNQLPLAVPEDLRSRLERFHASPPVWWIGQLLKFLLKPKPKLAKLIQETGDRLAFAHPVVGVHVRRTDKVGTEAAFHSIEEYMERVDEWFRKYELLHPPLPASAGGGGARKRNVFLATDEPLLLDEAKSKFPSYNFISDNNISKSAGLSSRYSEASLHGIILDIHFLAQSDFLVCTFSSQVCRVAYELMQTLHPDASENFASLDDIFYFGGQNAHNVQAIYPHRPTTDEEMSLEVGDLVGIAGNHWDGFSKGRNRRLDVTGLFPSYKVRDAVDWVPFPLYNEALNSTSSSSLLLP